MSRLDTMMQTSLFILGAVLCSALHVHAAPSADSFFKICHRSDPKLNECVVQCVNDIRPLLRKGIPALKMLSVEPMKVPRVQVLQGSGPVSIDSTFKNLSISGITSYEVYNASVDPDKYFIQISVMLPYLYVAGDYEINGRVLILPISGNGDSWSNYTGVGGVATLQGSPVTRNGKEYMNLDSLKFSISVQHAQIQMNNLFNGNKELGDAMNRFMSENWQAVFSELKPVVDEAISALLKDSAQKVFNNFPYDELFPK